MARRAPRQEQRPEMAADQENPYNTNGQNFGTGKPEPKQGGPDYFGGQQHSGPSYTQQNGFDTDQGWNNRNTYGGSPGGADTNVNRYRGLGQSSDQRPAYQANYGDYNSSMQNADVSRQQQRDALYLQAQAAEGKVPSKAEILGQQMTQNALANQVAAAGSARGGPMQQAAMMNNAAAGASQYTQMAANAQMAQRAEEMERARNAYMTGATDIRSGDYTGAGIGLQKSGQELQNEQFQRAQNQQAQEYYEGLANDVNKTQLAANQNAEQIANGQFASNQAIRQGDEGLSWDKTKTIVGTAVGAATGGVGAGFAASDERMKTSITDPGGEGAGELGMGGPGGLVKGTIGHENSLVSGAFHNQTGGPIAGRMLSDPLTKQDVHEIASERSGPEVSHSEESRRMREAAERNTRPNLDAAMREGTEGANPYQKEAPGKGVAGAPRGYAAEREGKPGSYFGGPEVSHGYEPMSPDAARVKQGNLAPGTEDTVLSGREGEPDWAHGGATTTMGAQSPGGPGNGGWLGAMLTGISKQFRPAARDTSVSDERAKQAAFVEGMGYMKRVSDYQAGGPQPGEPPAYASAEEKPSALQSVASSAGDMDLARGKFLTPEQREVLQHPMPEHPSAGRFLPPATREALLADKTPARLQFSKGAETPKNALESKTLGKKGATPEASASGPVASRDTMESDEHVKKIERQEEPMRAAMHSMKASEYEYRPEFTPNGQQPGEKNVGPMAQNMAMSPVARTAIVKDPNTGLLGIDKEKGLKLVMGSLASLQRQVDALDSSKRRSA